MQARFVQVGNQIDYTPNSDVAAGAVVALGTLIGIAERAIAGAALGALTIRGVFQVVKDNSNVTTAGTPAYWDADGDPVGGEAGTGAFTSTANGNVFAGFFITIGNAQAETINLYLCSMDSSIAEKFSVNQLSDVGTVAYTAGKILVADGNSYEEVAVSGDAALASNGALTVTAVNGVTPGTVTASKAVIVDASKDITGLRNMTTTGALQAATLVVTNLPTTDPEVEGAFWLDTGTLKVSAGAS